MVIGFGATRFSDTLPPVKAGFAHTGEDPARYVSPLPGRAPVLPALAEAAQGIGALNLSEDLSFGVVRRTPMIWSDGVQLYPSLAVEVLGVAQGERTYIIHADTETGGVQSVRIGSFEVPTEPNGELHLYYIPPRPDLHLSAADIFDNDKLRELVPKIEGRIVLVGTSASGLHDLRKSTQGDTIPGVEIHAQAIEQIINDQYLRRHDWTRGLEIVALIIAGAWDAFRRLGVLIDPSFPLIGGVGVWFVATAFRYVPPSLLKQIESNYRKVRLGGENCELTVLFTDVRSFTKISERMTPEQVVSFLNTLLGRLGAEVSRESGVIDKFIGDSVMAFWNAPLRQKDHARHALRAALAMRAAVVELNAKQEFGPARGNRPRRAGGDRHRHQHRDCLRRQCRLGRALQLLGDRRRGERGRADRSDVQGCRLRHRRRPVDRRAGAGIRIRGGRAGAAEGQVRADRPDDPGRRAGVPHGAAIRRVLEPLPAADRGPARPASAGGR